MSRFELGASGPLAGVKESELAHLAGVMRIEKYPRAFLLVEEGDIPDKFFVLVEGHAAVFRAGKHLADLSPGDFFGERGVLSLEPRNASVIATTPVRVAVAFGWDIRSMLGEVPGIHGVLAGAVVHREDVF